MTPSPRPPEPPHASVTPDPTPIRPPGTPNPAQAASEPNGCTYCGVAFRDHFQRWTEAAGWHGWTEPTDAQRLTRMRARRAWPLGGLDGG